MEKRREIDFANVFLCLLVMLIHILSKAVSALDRTSLQFAAVYIPSRLSSFVVQGFIFLSAVKYFMRYKDGGFDYVGFIKARLKTIVIPYILWNIIYYFALMPLGYFIFDMGELIKYIFLGNMISHFYFVVIIVQFYVLMPFWLWIVKKIKPSALIPVSAVIMIIFGQYAFADFVYNDRIFLKYIFYWICGCYVGSYYEKVIMWIKKYSKYIIAVFAAAAVTDGLLTWVNSAGIRYIGGLENIHIIYCTVAIAFVLTLGVYISGYIVDKKIFSVINRQSYNIYLSHCLTLYYADYIAAECFSFGHGELLLFRAFVCCISTFVLWGAYDCIKRRIMYKSGC